MSLLTDIHNSLIFYPSKEFCSSPREEGIPHEEIFIDTDDDEKLHGYFFPHKEKTSKVVIYLHGNAQNVGDWYRAPIGIQKYVPINALLVDYRGYGKSTGKPTIEGVITDALAMYKYLTQRGFKPKDISVYGRSIGGAIALELATREKVRSVVVQSSFTSLKDIAKQFYPFIPTALIQDSHWNSNALIKKIRCPVLISHGDKDEIVNVNHSFKLFKSANKPKRLIILKGATHNDISMYFNDRYFQALCKIFI